MIGDAVELEVGDDGRLLAWKPAFGGRLLAAVTARSPVQVATVRPGTGRLCAPRAVAAAAPVTEVSAAGDHLVHLVSSAAVDDVDALLAAATVVGVGQGVAPSDHPRIHELCATLGAELAATRKVTDKGWAAHSRQVGVTGLSLAPDLYLAIGVSGKQNHMLGVQNARVLAAINPDPAAPIHDLAEASIVAPWQEVVPVLIDRIRQRALGAEPAATSGTAGHAASNKPAPASGSVMVPSAQIPQLAHWQTAPPPTYARDGRPLRYFAGTFYATKYQRKLNQAATSTTCRSEPDGTLIRQVEEHGEAWVQERWGPELRRLDLAAAGITDGGPGAPGEPLLDRRGDVAADVHVPGWPGRLQGLPLLVAGLVHWARARESRPLIGLRVCATPGPGSELSSLTLSAWHLPWGTIEFELYRDGTPVGQALAMFSCGPGVQPTAAGSHE